MKPKLLDPVKPNRRIGVFTFLVVVFVLKLLVVFQLRDHPLIQPDAGLDTTAYVTLANQVLSGNLGLGPGLYYVSPLYIYVLAAILAIAHSYTVVRVVQIALGTGTVLCVYLMARAWFGAIAAWAAAVLAALTGVFTFFELLILQSSIDGFLTAAALCALTFALTGGGPEHLRQDDRSARFVPALVAGLLFGIQTLNRPQVLIGALTIAGVALLGRRTRLALTLATGVAVGMAPVAIRNVVVAGQFSFVSSHGGLNFYIGNGDGATGYYHPVAGISPNIDGQEKDVVRVASRALGHPATDSEASSYFYGLAWTWIRQHPMDAATLLLRKVGYTFHAQFIALPDSYPFFAREERTLLSLLVVGPWLLVPLGVAGLALARRMTDRYIVWLAFVPGYAAAVAVFFIAERYRLPLLVALTVGAGGAIQAAVEAVRARDRKPLVVLAAAVVPLAVAVNWPLQRDDGRWLSSVRLAERLYALGRVPDADAVLPRAKAIEPRPGATDYRLGEQLLNSERSADAVPFLERAHSADPGDPTIEFTLGRALLKAGRPHDALPHLQRGFDAGVPLPQGGIDYAAALRDAGAYGDAVAVLRRIPPGDDPDLWLRIGRMAVEARAPDAAEPFFRRAVALRPDAAAHQQLGLDLLVLEKFDDAARELTEAARLDPRDADTLSRLAYCEIKLGRLDDARVHVGEALAVNPSDALARQLAAALR